MTTRLLVRHGLSQKHKPFLVFDRMHRRWLVNPPHLEMKTNSLKGLLLL